MSVSAPIPAGVVSQIEGSVRVIRAGGKTAGALKVGDTLQQGDAVIAAVGARLQLEDANGQIWETPADGLPADQATGVSTSGRLLESQQALLARAQGSLDDAVARLETSSDEDAPAAGLAGGASGALAEGLRVGRVQESVGTQEYAYETADLGTKTGPQGGGVINGDAAVNAPPVVDLVSSNLDPVAGNYGVSTSEDTAVSGKVVATDADGDTLSYAVGTGPANGSVTVNTDGTWTYTPSAHFNGSDSFTVTVSDGQGGVTTATVQVGVTPVNDAPVAQADSATVAEGGSVLINLAGNDGDIDSALDLSSIVITSAPANGSVTVNADGTVSYAHNGSETTADSFSYTIQDAQGLTSAPVNVAITITGVNDLPVIDPTSSGFDPVAGNYSATTPEDTAVSGKVVATDADGDTLSYAVGTGPANGSVTVNTDGTWTYTPSAHFNGSDSFTVTVSDGQGGVTTATVQVGVTPVNDAPVAQADSATVAEGDSVLINLAGNDGDIDSALDLSSIVITSAPANGSVTVNADGTVSYAHNGSETTADSFSYTIQDAQGLTSAPVNVAITITGVNDLPVIDPTSSGFDPVAGNYSATTPEDTAVSGKVVATDADGDTLSYAVGTGPANGNVTVNTDGTWTYTPSTHFNGSDTFTVTVSDGQGGVTTATVQVGVTPVNDAPVAQADSATVAEGSSVLINLAGNDGDIDSALDLSSIVITSAPANGSVTVNADGTVSYAHNGSETTTDSFSYTIRDAQGLTSAPVNVAITITGVNDLPVIDPTSSGFDPVAGNYSATTPEDTAVSGKVVATDADGDTLAYALGSGPANGTVAVNTDGTWTYTPSAHFNGSDSFTVTVSDGQGGVTTATVQVGVTPVNDAPVAQADSATVAEGGSVLINLAGNDGDIDSALDLSSIVITSAPANGSVTVNADGTVSYAHNGSETTADSFSYTIQDAQGLTSAPVNVAITITGVNDLPVIDPTSSGFDPVAGNYSVTTPEDTAVSGKVVATDADGDPLAYALGNGPANGSVTVNTDGTWTYTPSAHFNGSDTFTVTVSDGQGGVTTATVQVGVTPVNDAPVAQADSATVAEGDSVLINLAGNDGDIDSALDLSSIVITSAPANGSVTVNADGTVSYAHNGSETTADSFSYTIRDTQGLTSAPVNVAITVTGVNDLPVIDPTSSGFDPVAGNYSATTPEDTAVSGKVVATDADGDTLAYALGSGPANGTVTVHTDGTWTYTPSAHFNGSDSFTVTVSDGQGGVTTATVQVGVTPVNDAPVAQADSATVAEGGSVLINLAGNDGDIDSALDLSSIVITSAPANGSVTVNADGTVSYAHNGSETTTDSFSYTIQDAQGLTSAPVNVAITVTGVNDAPVIDPTSSGFDPVAGNYSATTPEDTSVSGKVVATDADGDTLAYALGSGPANGTVTVHTDGTWTYTPSANFNGSDTFTVTVSDGQGGVTTATVQVGVTPVNDAPVAQADSATVAEGSSVLINLAGNDGDIDSALDLSSIVITSAPANGSVTVNADGTVNYAHNGSETTADNFTYTIQDAQGLTSAPVNVTITVTGVNDLPVIDPASSGFNPVAGNYSATTPEDTSVSGKVVATDADGDTLAYALGSGPANGTVTVHTDGTWTYTPSAHFHGSDTFTVTVSDGQGGVTTATVQIGVTPVNDAPVAQADSATVTEGGSVIIHIADNDGDIDSALDLSSIVITSAPANGSVTVNADGTVSYAHNGSETTADSFTYTIQDAQGLTSAPVSVAITITGVNDLPVIDPTSSGFDPVAGNYSVTTPEDTAVSGKVVATDADGDTLSYAVGTGPANGSVTVNTDGTWTYTPSAHFNGSDSFTVTVSDGQGGVTTATVQVGVTPVNDAPVAQADSATVAEGDSVLINLAGNDGDIDSALDLSSIVITSAPANGSVTVNADGTVSYAHNGSETTADSFSYTIQDAQGLTSAPVNVAITVTGVNDAPVIDPTSSGFDPVAGNYSATTPEDTAVSGKVVATDADGDTLSYAVGTGPANGSITVNTDGTWTYTPSANFNGSDTFTVTVSDGQGGVTTATVQVGVTPVNDAPVAQADSATVAEGDSVLINLAGNDGDIDSALDLSSIVITSAPANGSVTVNADGTVSYAHNGSETTADSFSYTIQDAQGLTSAPVNVAITITGVNDLPVIDPASAGFDPVAGNYSATTPEDTAVSGKVVATDADGDTLSYAVGTGPANGNVTVNTDGTWTYTPSANFNGSDTFTVTVSDGQGGVTTATVQVGVTPVNDAPITTNQSKTTAEDTSVTGKVIATDVDGDTLSYSVQSGAAHGTVVLNPTTGDYTYTPAANYNGADSFAVRVNDGKGGFVDSIVNVTVTPVNDAPVANNDSLTAVEDTAATYTAAQLLSNDTDVDSTNLKIASVTAGSGGSVVLNADGTVTFTPNANFNGTANFTYTVTDGALSSSPATVTIAVSPVNDAPVAVANKATTAEDTAVTGKVIATDVDGDTLSYSVQSGAAHGTLVLNPTTGDYTYTPAANYNGADSFTVRVNDGKGGFVDSVVSVTVTPVNDVPITANQSKTTAEDTSVTGKVVATDVDGDALSYSVQSGAAHGTVVLNGATGDYSYTPAANYNGTDSFTVRVSDGKGGFVDSIVNVTVTPVNDAPVVGTATSSLLEAKLSAGAVTQTGAISVSDVDNQPLTVKLITPSTSLTSSGTSVAWSLSTDGKTLVGTAGNTEVLRATIDNLGNYSVTLSKAIDHASVQGQNVASFNIGVSASDGSATTLSNLSINITDDTPQASAVTHNLRVRTDAINVNDLDAGFSGDTYLNGTGQVTRTNVDSHDTLIDQLRWGNAATNAGRSGYDLVDNANFTTSTGAAINTGTPFKLGDFTHSNYGIYSGSSTLDYTDVTIRMDVVINGVSTPVAFTVRLDHTETTNSSDAIASRDIITLPAQTVSVQIAGQSYTVNLLGFQDRSGNIVNTIYTDENTNNNTFGIYAQVTSTQAPVQASGELLSQAGADGAYLSELVIDGNRYAYNTANGGSVSMVSGINQGTFSTAEQVFTVKTALGGTFVIDLDDGNYTYTAPSNVTTSASDRLDFTVRDADGDTASSSVVVNVAPPALVTLSNSGTPYQGSSDPENITGSSGNDTIYGGGGADHISGGGGADTIYGGQGSDVLTGGQGADVFAWSLGDGGTPGKAYHDVIADFSTATRSAGGDVLDLRDLLQGELHSGTNAGNLTDFLRFETVGTNTVLHISSTGAYGSGYTVAKDDQTITLQGVDLTSSNSLSNTQIIQNLLTAGKLITD